MATGKIAFHFPNRSPSNPNFDTVDIKFVPKGGNSSSIRQVSAVYHIPHGFSGTLTLADLQQHLVWAAASLTAGSTNVAIEFVPSTDIQVTSVSIFTANNYNNANGARVKIFHESGIYVGAVDGDVISAQSTKHGLSGYEHTASFSLTLYAGKKYYIVYQGATNEAFYPAYYDSHFTGKYKAYANTTGASNITPYPNINSIYAFMPSSESQRDLTEEMLKTIMDTPLNATVFWLGNNVSPNGTDVFKYGYLTTKQMSTPNAQVTTADSDIWGYAADTYFIWHNKQNTQVIERAYRKTATTSHDGDFVLTSNATNQQEADTLLALKNGSGSYSKMLSSVPDPYNGMGVKLHHLLSIKTGYSVGLETNTPISAQPAGGWVNDTFYYLQDNIDYSSNGGPGIFYGGSSICIKTNGNWVVCNPNGISDLMPFFNDAELSTVTAQIPLTSLCQLGQQISNDENLRNASVVTGSKYYLKINGNEV